MDILTEIPIELAVGVLKYLPPISAIQLRVVSRRYYDLLTSDETCRSLSRQFITPKCNSTRGPSPWRLHYENYVSRRFSFTSGKPWSVIPLGGIYDPYVTIFCPETLRLVLPTSTTDASVSVRDLNTYPPKCLLPPTPTPDESVITHAALLPSFVVVVTEMGNGYAWNLETHEKHQLKLPDSPVIDCMHGSGNMVAISLEGWVVIHDAQAQKTSMFEDTRSGILDWEGERFSLDYENSFITINPEKQVVWVISQTDRGERGWLFITDSFHFGTGEFFQRDIRVFLNQNRLIPFNAGNGTWLFVQGWDGRTSRRSKIEMATERVAFDQATGQLTVECFPLRCNPPGDLYYRWGPAISAGGLGCFIDDSLHCVWMLNQEPGDEMVRAQPLDSSMLSQEPGGELARAQPPDSGTNKPLGCIWFCEKFALLYSYKQVHMVRFKGIHDASYATGSVSMPPSMLI